MSKVIDKITSAQLHSDIPKFRLGDTVHVHAKVVEGERERIQIFEGLVIKCCGAGVKCMFSLHTSCVAKIEVPCKVGCLV